MENKKIKRRKKIEKRIICKKCKALLIISKKQPIIIGVTFDVICPTCSTPNKIFWEKSSLREIKEFEKNDIRKFLHGAFRVDINKEVKKINEI